MDNDVKIRVTKDENGNEISSFYIDPETKTEENKEVGFWESIFSWFKRHEIKPYVTRRNINTPTRENECIKPVSEWEIGIKGTF